MTADLSFLDLSPRKSSPTWTPVKVVVYGGDRYRMVSVDAEVRIDFVPGGFETKFKDRFAIPAELLIGSCFSETTIFDIEIQLPGLSMSMARMNPKKFPRVVRKGETVGING